MSETVTTAPFRLTAEEITAGVTAAYPAEKGWLARQPAWVRIALWCLLFLVALALLNALDGYPWYGTALWALLALFLGVAIGAWLTSSLVQRHMRRMISAQVAREVDSTVTYSDAGVEVTTPESRQSWRWSTVDRTVIANELFVLSVGLMSVSCPARALPEGITLPDLQARVESWRAAA